ncbi:MAG TPA: FAD-dependent oxidoreductase [Candidatus Dormibacteraeota bacterium]|nr:FAD-dependent oxidoreductase [Candidatus Dormibacteraeota bacterium]
MTSRNAYDVAVIGGGVFGAWIAWHLAQRGKRAILLDAYGPAHARASSGGESRIIRMGYGADELYTRWAMRSLAQWKDLFAKTNQPLFHETSVLWLADARGARLALTAAALKRCNVAFEEMDRQALEKRYPQMSFDGVNAGLLESRSGVLMARRAVGVVVSDAIKRGATYSCAHIITPRGSGRLQAITASSHEAITAEQYVFACGAWLSKVFPEVLGPRIVPSRQEVFFFGVPPGDLRFTSPALPTWLFQDDEVYGMPDIEGRGLKIALDRHGERVDPDTQSRLVSSESAEWARRYVARRFPALRDSPIVETRVCQYENTSNGDFLIDRHPEMENVWLVGGGSGHGFKHGPAVGEYTASQLLNGTSFDGTGPEPRFSLATKGTIQSRAIY